VLEGAGCAIGCTENLLCAAAAKLLHSLLLKHVLKPPTNTNQTKPNRFSRDKEASIRRSSITLLANLLSPGATPTQRMLITGWPDCGARLMRVACDAFECHAVRAAALAFVCAAAAVDPIVLAEGGVSSGAEVQAPEQREEEEGEGGRDPGDPPAAAAATAPGALRRLHRLGLAALLQQQQLWEALLPLLGAAGARAVPPALSAAACALAAQALAADPAGVGVRLLVGRADWEGPQPLITRALAAALPPGQPGSFLVTDRAGGASSGGGSSASGEVDVPSALMAVVRAGVGAQGGVGGMPEELGAYAQSLEWLAAAG